MYSFKEINDKSRWNNFITGNDFAFYTFLQSWEWGEVQKDLGKEIVRFGIYQKDELIGACLVLKVHAKRGNYIFLPHGPLILGTEEEYFKIFGELLQELKVSGRNEGFGFIRCNFPIKNSKENKKSSHSLGGINAPMHENVEDTHLLDITLSDEELLKNMKKGDRYYINRAIKEGVEIRVGNHEKHISSLINMHISHSKRDNGKHKYTPFSEIFTKSLYKHFGKNISTISASYNGNIESILMTIRFGKVCVYYIAASDIKNPKFSPNYLCQWEAIKKAKQDGCEIYNFWGVSPDDNPKHPIAGVSKFKRKFAGYDYSLLHAQDYPLSFKYRGNYAIETIRRKKRGYYYKKPV